MQPHCVPERNVRSCPRMGQCVGQVFNPWNFGDNEFSQSDLLLQPALLHVKVANLPHSLPHNDTAYGGRVSLQLKTGVVLEVVGYYLGIAPSPWLLLETH